MAIVAKHNAEHERESDDAEWRWVSLHVGRNAVGVDELLEEPRHVVELEEGRRIELMRFVGVVAVAGELSRLKIAEALVNHGLHFIRGPEEADVGGLARFHHVERIVDCLLFGNEPFVDLERAYFLLRFVFVVIK